MSKNTGGTSWLPVGREKFTQEYDEIYEFKTLDYLCETKIIKEKIHDNKKKIKE